MFNTALAPATAFVALFALVPPASAMPMGGTFNARVDGQAAQPMGAAGQVRISRTASGTNTGPGTPLDGAAVRIKDMAVLKNGQGSVKGTIVFVTANGSTSSPYSGTLATDAAGRMTVEGTFHAVKGKGEFSGMKGRGQFSVAHSSPTDFSGTWQGDFQIPPQRTSRR